MTGKYKIIYPELIQQHINDLNKEVESHLVLPTLMYLGVESGEAKRMMRDANWRNFSIGYDYIRGYSITLIAPSIRKNDHEKVDEAVQVS